MTIHIALYQFKPSVTDDEISNVFKRLTVLGPQIPNLASINCAKNTSQYSEGYDYVILVRAKNQAAIDAYRNHPEHKTIAKQLDAMEEKSIGVDFSTGE
jgi:hypothetical protein